MDFEDVCIILGFTGLALIAVFLLAILGILVGAFVGWCISWNFLGDWVADGFRLFGYEIRGSLVQVGAMLGFIGGLLGGFASRSSSHKEE